ncbi:hypothetical protein ACFX13_035571 [Malus domestica]
MNPKKPERPDRTHSSAHDPTTKPDPFTMPFVKTHQRGSYSRQPIQVSARNLLMMPSNLHIRSATSRRRPTHPTMLLVPSSPLQPITLLMTRNPPTTPRHSQFVAELMRLDESLKIGEEMP